MQEPTALPPHLVELSIAAKHSADVEKLRSALLTMTSTDALFRVKFDRESGQFFLQGMDEQHLDTKVDILRHSYGCELYLGAPQVAYLETIARPVEQEWTHDVQIAGEAQFARVRIVFEPKKCHDEGLFRSEIIDEAMPQEFISGIETGIRGVMQVGIFAGFPVVSVMATLVDATYLERASSVLAFEIAGRAASRQALQSGGSVLLEPIMKVEVITPQAFVDSVVGDFQSRRGAVLQKETSLDGTAIVAIVPLVNLFGYRDQLRCLSRGCATFAMKFERYEPAPQTLGRPPPASTAALRARAAWKQAR